MPANDLIVYAKWTPAVYTVSFELAGGIAPEGSENAYVPQTNISKGDTAVKPVDPVREGYTFAGWRTKDGKPFSFSTPISKDYVLVAQWVGNTAHTVTYVLETGSDVSFVDDEQYAAGADVKVLKALDQWIVTNKEAGLFFVCWKDSEGNTYYPGETFEMPDANVTLVAQWSAERTTTLTYDYNYEDGPENKIVLIAEPNELYTITEAPTRPGYIFLGWSQKQNPAPEEDLLKPGKTIQVDTLDEKNNILYAQWQAANGNLVIEKKLTDMNALKGESASFTFEVKNSTGETYYHVFTFKGAGSQSFEFKDLQAGQYTVREITTSGYEADAQEKTVNVPAGGTKTVTFSNSPNGNIPGDNDFANNQFKYENGQWKWNRNDSAAYPPAE